MKKAQFWYADFLVAVMILMIIGMLFVVSIRDLTSRNEILKDLTLEASDISSVLMTEGYGTKKEWEKGMGTIGFLTDNKFDENKFLDFSELNYPDQKSMLGTFNNVAVYRSGRNGIPLGGISNFDSIETEFNLEQNSIQSVEDISKLSDNLVHIKRFVFFDEDDDGKGDIYTLGVVVFR